MLIFVSRADHVIFLTAHCSPMASRVDGCAILNTKLIVATIGPPPPQVHRDVLRVLEDAFRENRFDQYIPELVSASFLGPDSAAIAVSTQSLHGASNSGNKTVAIVFSATCIVLMLIVIACASSQKIRDAIICGKLFRQKREEQESRLLPTGCAARGVKVQQNQTKVSGRKAPRYRDEQDLDIRW